MVQLVYDAPWWSEKAATLALRDAKPIGTLPSGHSLFLERQKRDLFFIVADPETGSPIAYLELEKFSGSSKASWQEHHVTAAPSIRGTRIILDLYRHLILDRGILLVSDDIQTPGGRSIWAKLAMEPDILLSAWDGSNLFSVDEDLDSSLEIYIDPKDEARVRESIHALRVKLRSIRERLLDPKIRPATAKALKNRRNEIRDSLAIAKNDLLSLAERDGSTLLIAQPSETFVEMDLSAWR